MSIKASHIQALELACSSALAHRATMLTPGHGVVIMSETDGSVRVTLTTSVQYPDVWLAECESRANHQGVSVQKLTNISTVLTFKPRKQRVRKH